MNQHPPPTVAPAWSPHLIRELSAQPDLPNAASLLAAHAVPVFPCIPAGKRPLVEHGFHEATCDPETVAGWWRRWPTANVAIPTGFASGVDVVDVDVHPTGNGYRAFADARARGLLDGWAWSVRTPSGGLHAYFLRTASDEQRSWQAPRRHIDFRGDGGYIVVPPSRTPAGDYRVIAVSGHESRSVNGPALRHFLDPPPIQSIPHRGGAANSEHLAAWVASQQVGSRNRSLFWAACRMVENGHAFDETASTLGAAAQRAGLDEREAITTIRSAYRTTSPTVTARTTRTRTPPTPAERRVHAITSEGIEQ